LLASALLCSTAPAQQSETPATTRALLGNLETQLQKSETKLQALRAGDTLNTAPIEVILSRTGEAPRPRVGSQTILPTATPTTTTIPEINLTLTPDATLKVRDRSNTVGLILTGKWITDYARLIQLVPEYEKTLAGYRSQAELQKQLIAEIEGVANIKDKKIEVLNEMREALQKRGDLYKDIAEVNKEPFFERVLRKLAFPAGITVGIVVGSVIAK